MSPSFVGIVPSIEMVILTAVGGRMSLIGAVLGALLVNFGKTYFSEQFPELWLYLMGGLFIAVVMIFPNGIAGSYRSWLEAAMNVLRAAKRKVFAGGQNASEIPAVLSRISQRGLALKEGEIPHD